jgi:hypothetical protein
VFEKSSEIRDSDCSTIAAAVAGLVLSCILLACFVIATIQK